MTWDKLDNLNSKQSKQQLENAKAEAAAKAKLYHAVFSSPEGKRVLEDLTNRFVMSNDTQLNATNVTYEAGYHNGEAGVVKMIINEMQRAQVL